jgi:hypothetical protein
MNDDFPGEPINAPLKPIPAELHAAHLHYDAATRALKDLKKYANAFAFVRGAVPDKKLASQLAAYTDAVETISATIPKITDPNHTYEPCELREIINKAAKRDKKFRDALNLTGFER